MANWMDIEAKLSEAAWELIESHPESEDILNCLGMGFHVLIDNNGIVAATPRLDLTEYLMNEGHSLINVDTGKVIF